MEGKKGTTPDEIRYKQLLAHQSIQFGLCGYGRQKGTTRAFAHRSIQNRGASYGENYTV